MSCAAQSEEGSWASLAPTNGITRVVIRFTCQDQILNGHPFPPGPPFHVHLWGSCHPSDCDWGEVGASRLSTGQIYAYYDQGFAKRYVYAQITTGDTLWLSVHTHFTDPNRGDYSMDNWYRRQAAAQIHESAGFTVEKRKVDKGTRLSAMSLDLDPASTAIRKVNRHDYVPIPTVSAPSSDAAGA